MKFANLRTALIALKSDRSVVETASVLYVSPNTLSNWINGRHLPPNSRLPQIANALGMDVAEVKLLVDAEKNQGDLTGVVADHAPIISGGAE